MTQESSWIVPDFGSRDGSYWLKRRYVFSARTGYDLFLDVYETSYGCFYIPLRSKISGSD